ncbi:MAG: DUF4129 domain-containing protein [Flavobacteriaceae bacterium]|nr:DUF4129 domain-containing protein [Flavobacteriaceae bacterium]
MKFKLILFILSFCFYLVGSQGQAHTVEKAVLFDKTEVEIDPTQEEIKNPSTAEILAQGVNYNESLELRHFKDGFQADYKGADYDYSLTKPRESIWSKIKRKLIEFLSRFLSDKDAGKINEISLWIMRILGIGIVGLVVFWLLRFLIQKEGNWFFSKKNKNILPQATIIDENIHELDFQQLIAEKELQKDYRFAVRYNYLALLKSLSDKKLIEWDPEKTNRDYLTEISNIELKKEFASLTYIFDYVWYGEFDIEQPVYEKFKTQFSTFKNKI